MSQLGRSPPGDKYLLWIEDPGAQHMLIAGEMEPCLRAIRNRSCCEEMREWLRSAVRAFLDAHLRHDQAAAEYLASDALVEASGGVVEWKMK